MVHSFIGQALEKDGSSLLDLEQLKEENSAQSIKKEEILMEDSKNDQENTKIIIEGKVMESSDVLQMHKELNDIQTISETREKKIKEVR